MYASEYLSLTLLISYWSTWPVSQQRSEGRPHRLKSDVKCNVVHCIDTKSQFSSKQWPSVCRTLCSHAYKTLNKPCIKMTDGTALMNSLFYRNQWGLKPNQESRLGDKLRHSGLDWIYMTTQKLNIRTRENYTVARLAASLTY